VFSNTKLPDFLIVGAQKAGTTSLADYLASHPDAIRPVCKEVHYFDVGYGRGVEWYRSHFPVGKRRELQRRMLNKRLFAGDASPYYLFHPLASSRAFQLLPDARIVIMLRDPVDRAYSHYHHERRHRWESLSFEQALAAEASRLQGEAHRIEGDPAYYSFEHQHFSYLARGIYLPQVKNWLKHYDRDQILVISSERFFEDPASEYQRVIRFLGVREWRLHEYQPQHVGTYRPLSSETREQLTDYYKPHNEELRDFLDATWAGVGSAVVERWTAVQESRLRTVLLDSSKQVQRDTP
jgi:hypothetical protein